MRHRVLALIAGTLLLAACQVEQRVTGPVEVMAPEPPPSTLVSIADVRLDAELLGTVRTYRFDDEAGRQVHEVRDELGRVAGHVTDDGRAYRITAHEGSVLVSQNPAMAVNVAAVLGRPLDRVQIVRDPRIAP